MELIKNAYDADADRVEVRFEGFRDDMTHDKNSRIVVRDDGAGMSIDTVRTGWMNPAAPQKFLDKRRGNREDARQEAGSPGREGYRPLRDSEAGQGDHRHDAPARREF